MVWPGPNEQSHSYLSLADPLVQFALHFPIPQPLATARLVEDFTDQLPTTLSVLLSFCRLTHLVQLRLPL